MEKIQSGYVKADGARLYYEIAGEGPFLVLVHAGIADRRMWDAQFGSLARDFRVLRYDMRGFGKSSMTSAAFSRRGDLLLVLETLGFTSVHLVGCSMGGGAVIDLALEHPERVAALILVSPAVGGYAYTAPPPASVLELIDALKRRDFDRAAEQQVRIWVDGPKRAPGAPDKKIRDLVREMSRDALTLQAEFLSDTGFVMEEPMAPPAFSRLDQIRVPVLVIAGDCDDDTNMDIARALANKIASAKLSIISGAAHLPNMEKPDEFNRMVLEFLKGQLTAPGRSINPGRNA
jgi:pimeloyl-ACP methyl ester carboxylesterase